MDKEYIPPSWTEMCPGDFVYTTKTKSFIDRVLPFLTGEGFVFHVEPYGAGNILRCVKSPLLVCRMYSGLMLTNDAKTTSPEHEMVSKKCRVKVNRKIKNGEIKRLPCEKCGAEKSHAHHDDYRFPYKVRWLCPKHHREWHDNNQPIYPFICEGE